MTEEKSLAELQKELDEAYGAYKKAQHRAYRAHLEAEKKATNYEIGYQDGESSAYAEWVGALSEVLPANQTKTDPTPTSVAAYIQELEDRIENMRDGWWQMIERSEG